MLVAIATLAWGAFLFGRTRPSPRGAAYLSPGAPVARPAMLEPVDATAAKNLILIVGDGMGFNQVAAGRIALKGSNGLLWIETLPNGAIVRTKSASSLVPDSAAGGTAIATGVLVGNGAISLDASGRAIPTLFEEARRSGRSAGIATTARITDATPAAFSAHVKSRAEELEIAKQQAASGIELLLGCQPEKFLPRPRGGERNDGLDLVEQLRGSGYSVILDPAALVPSTSGRLLGLFSEAGRPPLGTFTRTAIDTLRHDPDGFVLLIESEETDSASHNHQLDRLIRGMRELDEAVRVALEFARADGNTLVVITSDHETGGLQLVETKEGNRMEVKWATGKHTGQPVPLYAWGPGASHFTGGEIDQTDVHALLERALGMGTK